MKLVRKETYLLTTYSRTTSVTKAKDNANLKKVKEIANFIGLSLELSFMV